MMSGAIRRAPSPILGGELARAENARTRPISQVRGLSRETGKQGVNDMKVTRVARFLAISISAALILGFLGLRAEEFSQERAYEHLRHLAGTIGARPLGSPQEKEALDYFARKISELGGKVEWQPVNGTGEPDGKDSLNTSSFNVIGRFEGESPRQIIIGAHIDSSTPEIAGADDDGSGIAAILEAARVLAGRPRHSTLVFVAFCGEEAGLVGSKYFAKHYPLDDVALMLQLDMTSDDAPLMLWIDSKKKQSPAWLVSASLDIYHQLGYRRLDYPTIFQSLNGSLGGAGSDHEPFLEKGIPAIAFVSDVRHPIHTPFDTLEYFKPDGLARSGRLILGLIDRFDRGQPEEKTGRYMLVLVGGKPLFISPSWLAAFIVLSLAAAFLALVRLHQARGHGQSLQDDKRIRKSWPKLLLLHFFMLAVTFASFWILGWLKGVRLPWVLHPGAYVLYAFLFFILGVWLSLQILRRWRLRRNAFFYMIRGSIYLTVLILLAGSAGGPRLAFYAAAALFLISLACLVRSAWVKGILWLMSPVLMFRLLVLPEYYQFVYRSAGLMGFAAVGTALAFAAVNLVVILFSFLWSEPFLLGFAAVYRSAGTDLFGLRKFRRPIALVPLGVFLIAGAAWLYRLPSYARPWEREVRIVERYDVAKDKTTVEFSSGDYLKGVRAEIGSRVEDLNTRTCRRVFDIPLQMDWLKAGVVPAFTDSGGETLARMRFELAFEKPPYSVSVRLTADRPFRVVSSSVRHRRSRNRVTMNWEYCPARVLQPEVELRLPPEAKLTAEVKAVFLEGPVPVVAAGEDTHFIRRSEVVRRIDIRKP